jgi:hypothetical protein
MTLPDGRLFHACPKFRLRAVPALSATGFPGRTSPNYLAFYGNTAPARPVLTGKANQEANPSLTGPASRQRTIIHLEADMSFFHTGRRPYRPLAGGLALMMLGAVPAYAQLLEPDQQPHLLNYGPAIPNANFPQWYVDRTGLALELCTAKNDILNLCLYDPPIAANTHSQTTGFGAEAFWWITEANIPTTTGDALLVMAVEAAFNTEEPIAGDEFAFGRIRIRIDTPGPGKYLVKHPFGEEIFEVTDADGINSTLDIGTFNPDYSGPLKSRIGAFLTWDPAVAPAAPAGYIGDPNTPHRITGSPYNYNKFRVELIEGTLPAGGLDGQGNNFIETDLFAVSGKIYNGTVPTPLASRRVTYDGDRLEVLVTSAPTATVTATYDTATGSTTVPLVGDGKGYFYVSTKATMPPDVTVKAVKNGNTESSMVSPVIDIVQITDARYDPMTARMTVTAKSSMPDATLTVEPFGTPVPSNLTAVVDHLPVPPGRVKVKSSLGGEESRYVIITSESLPGDSGGGTGGGTTPPPSTGTPPTALPDIASTQVNTPVVVNVLANDSDTDGLDPASITIVTQPDPAKGSVGLIDVAGIQVIPANGYRGSEPITLSYTVKDRAGTPSSPATVTVNIIAEQITVAQAEYRSSKGNWRIRGTSNATVGNTISAYFGTTLIGSATVDAIGDWDIRTTNSPAPAAGAVMTIKSSKGTTVTPVPYTTRR